MAVGEKMASVRWSSDESLWLLGHQRTWASRRASESPEWGRVGAQLEAAGCSNRRTVSLSVQALQLQKTNDPFQEARSEGDGEAASSSEASRIGTGESSWS